MATKTTTTKTAAPKADAVPKTAPKGSTKPKAKSEPKTKGEPKAKSEPKAKDQPKVAKDEPKPKETPAATTTPTAPATTTTPAAPKQPATGKVPAKPKVKGKKKAHKGKKQSLKFVIDCSTPAEDYILDPANFEKYLHDRIKVNGKAGVLGDSVSIARDGKKLTVTAEAPFSKRYLKYLTKKFLKKQDLRDWLHVVAANKTTYELRYYRIHPTEDEEAAE